MNKRLKEYNKDLSSHDLRLSYGSNLVAGGVDLPTVAKLMGDNLETITGTYIHSTDKGMDKAHEAIKLLNF